ncbi:MAG: hypothetical protein ACJAQT_002804 [Akkermansiaceae bacterium]|jgi:hypothetical protein
MLSKVGFASSYLRKNLLKQSFGNLAHFDEIAGLEGNNFH